MLLRILVILLTVAVTGFFGQPRKPITVKAGDSAPALAFSKVLSAPAGADWTPAVLPGRLSVLTFLGDVSHNAKLVASWNELVDQFAAQPVEFVWLTAEPEASVAPSLSTHPVKGWLLLDQAGATNDAYGIEFPNAVLVAADGKILGFDQTFIPRAETIRDAIAGHADLKAEPFRFPDPASYRPKFPPSETVHITEPSGQKQGTYSDGDYLNMPAQTLRFAVQELWDVAPARVSLPAELDTNKRYDFAVVLPKPEDSERIRERFRKAVQEHFHVTAQREERLMDVYVVTSAGRKPPASAEQEDDDSMGFSTSSSVGFAAMSFSGGPPPDLEDLFRRGSLSSLRSISTNGTTDDFCKALEHSLDRPVVNETHLDGRFSIQVEATDTGPNDFPDRLREATGLVITPARRTVQMLIFR